VGKVGKRVGGPPAGWVWLPGNGAAVDPKNPNPNRLTSTGLGGTPSEKTHFSHFQCPARQSCQ
jgi:hypothetical protein